LLNNNFGKFSAISLIDRQNLDKIIVEQDIAANGRFSDQDFISIGNLANAQYYLFGTIQRLSGERYALQLSVTEVSTGIRKANFIMNGSLSQIEGRGALINEATADLLDQIGVKLTEAGKRTLLAGNSSVVRAETGLAMGITALAGGDEVGAMFNITQAITFDPSNLEALSRLNAISTSISGGTISQKIVNDIQARERWIDVAKETVSFFKDHPPFEITFDPNLFQIGETDYVKKTANIGMRIALDPLTAGFTAINSLLEGLVKTGKRSTWGFSGWPLSDVTQKSQKIPGTAVFSNPSFKYKIDVELRNENNKKLSNSSITLTAEAIKFSTGNRTLKTPDGDYGVLQFSNVKADDLTQTLTIVIVAVNGIPSSNIIETGYINIGTRDLKYREQEQEGKLREAANLAQAQKEQKEADTYHTRRRNDWLIISGFFQWENGGEKIAYGAGFGVPFLSGFYWSPFPFTAIGFETRIGWGYVAGKIANPDSSDVPDQGIFSISPAIGLLYPIGNRVSIFTDALLEMGFIYDDNITAGYMAPGFDIGLRLILGKSVLLNFAYRGMLYKNFYAHSAGIGIGTVFSKW